MYLQEISIFLNKLTLTGIYLGTYINLLLHKTTSIPFNWK